MLSAEVMDVGSFIHDIERVSFSTSELVGFSCTYNSVAFIDKLFSDNQVDLRCVGINSVNKRKSEYLAGRICAKHCLDKIGYFNYFVKSNEDRSPVWPAGVVGSISHTENEAICIVGPSDQYLGVGIDIEKTMSKKEVYFIRDQILLNSEIELFDNNYVDTYAFHEFMTLVFSAKESIFKAIYPQIKKYFDFHAVKLNMIFEGKLYFELVENLSEIYVKGYELVLNYEKYDDFIATLVFIKVNGDCRKTKIKMFDIKKSK